MLAHNTNKRIINIPYNRQPEHKRNVLLRLQNSIDRANERRRFRPQKEKQPNIDKFVASRRSHCQKTAKTTPRSPTRTTTTITTRQSGQHD